MERDDDHLSIKRCGKKQCEHKYELVKKIGWLDEEYVAHKLECVAKDCGHEVTCPANSDKALANLMIKHNEWMDAKRKNGKFEKKSRSNAIKLQAV